MMFLIPGIGWAAGAISVLIGTAMLFGGSFVFPLDIIAGIGLIALAF